MFAATLGMRLATYLEVTVKFHHRMFCLRPSTPCALAWALSLAACGSGKVTLDHPVGVSDAPLARKGVERTPREPEPSEAASQAPEVASETAYRAPPRRFSSCRLPNEPANALLFSTDSRALRPRGQKIVDDLAACMLTGALRNETLVVRGYTDPRGSQAYNEELAVDRAATVRRHLVRRGVSPHRVRLAPVGEVMARGYGPESWQLDRRVEITISSRNDSDATQSEFNQEREALIETLEKEGIHDGRVLDALRTVPRHELVPESYQPFAYENRALPIGEGQTISQPYIVGLMTQLAQVDATDKVLEIGTGSGYQAAVLSLLAGEVYTIEIVESLGQRAERDLKRLGLSDRIHFRIGDGFSGWPEEAPFDAILVTAAPKEVPAPLVAQLREGGRLIVPVGDLHQELRVLEKKQGKLSERDVIPVRFVPMTGKAQEE